MKGYLVLVLVAAGLFVLLPVCFLQKPPATPTVATPTEEITSFTVCHSNNDERAVADPRELTLYAVMGELSPDAPEEAIKAQAVACYTAFCYAQLHDGEIKTALPYPEAFCESFWQERWGEAYEKSVARFRKAVAAVEGERLLFNNELILATYHALNPGKTEPAEVVLGKSVPYLKTVGSPMDVTATNRFTTVTVSLDDAKEVLKTLCEKEKLGEPSSWFGDLKKSEVGTVLSATICGTTQTGVGVQNAFSLPSAAFEVCVQGEDVIFTVCGNGHFLGMSVYGAVAMAEQGNTYKEILLHYYPDTVLTEK